MRRPKFSDDEGSDSEVRSKGFGPLCRPAADRPRALGGSSVGPMEEMDAETYLETRLDDQIDYYERAAERAKRNHMRLQTGILALSGLVTLLVEQPFPPTPGFRLAATAVSLLVPILTSLANFRKDGELWLSYRTMGELLKSERFLFLTGSGRYRDEPDRFAALVEAVEATLAAEHDRFRAVLAQTRKAGNEEPESPGRGPQQL